MSIIRFKSVLQPEVVGYQISHGHDDDALWRRYYHTPPREFLSLRIQQYDTLGDVGVQHSPLSPARMGNLEDCMASLVAHCEACMKLDGPRSKDVGEIASMLCLPSVRVDQVRMMEKIRSYDPAQETMYYSWSLAKLGRSSNLRHDKRYFKVTAQLAGCNPIDRVAMGFAAEHQNSIIGTLDWAYVRYQAMKILEPTSYTNPWPEYLTPQQWDALHVLFTLLEAWRDLAIALRWNDTVMQNFAQRTIAEQKKEKAS
jgi:hypothetical protein